MTAGEEFWSINIGIDGTDGQWKRLHLVTDRERTGPSPGGWGLVANDPSHRRENAMRVVRLFRRRGALPYRPRQWVGLHEWTECILTVNGREYLLHTRVGRGIRVVGYRTPDGPVYVNTHTVHGGRFGMKKVVVGSREGSAAAQLASLESTVWSHLKPLVAHCSVLSYEDGSPRRPGWVVVKTLGASWVVEVKDPDSCAKLVCVQPVLDDALALASLLLESDSAPWELDPWLMQQNGKHRRK